MSFETTDHKPASIVERQRIEAAGGFVAHDRVCAVLAVSRAFGDFMFKDPEDTPEQHMVTCVPVSAQLLLALVPTKRPWF